MSSVVVSVEMLRGDFLGDDDEWRLAGVAMVDSVLRLSVVSGEARDETLAPLPCSL